MIHNNKVYANADEKFVKGTILHAKNNKLYYDDDHTKPVLTTELGNLYLSGIYVFDAGTGVYYTPTTCAFTHIMCDEKQYNATAPTEE